MRHKCAYCGEDVDPYNLDVQILNKAPGVEEKSRVYHRKCFIEMPKEDFDRLWDQSTHIRGI